MERFVLNWCHLLFKGLKFHTLGLFTKIFECRTISGWSDVLNPFSCNTGDFGRIKIHNSASAIITNMAKTKQLVKGKQIPDWGTSLRKHIGIADEWEKVKKLWTSAHINSQLIHF